MRVRSVRRDSVYRRVKARVIAGCVSDHVCKCRKEEHTAYLHLVPQLCLALLARLDFLLLACLGASFGRHSAALSVQRNLAGMHVALCARLHALAPAAVLSRVYHTRWRTTRNFARSHTPRQPLGLLPLQLLQHLLDWNSIEDLLSRSGQDGQNSECAVLLVLLEASTQVLFRNSVVAHALPCFAELAQRILAGEIGCADNTSADGEVCSVAP